METNTTPYNGNSIVAGVSSLIVLIVIIVMVTSLLNNKNISALETRTEQLEANVQSLQTELSTSLTEPLITSPTNSEYETINKESIKSEPVVPEIIDSKFDMETPKVMVAALNQQSLDSKKPAEEPKIDQLKNQVETISSKVDSVTNKVNSVNSRIDSFSKKLDMQANSLQSILKNEIKILAKTETNKIKKFETQLTSISKDIVNLRREGKQLSIRVAQSKSTGLTNQIKNNDNSIKLLTNKLQNLAVKINSSNSSKQIQKLGQKIDQQINKLKSNLETEVTKRLSKLKSTLETKAAEQYKQQNAKIEVLETQLQMLIGGLMASSTE
ncbi:MAG: hypothetical protein QM487_12930 [Candidatus Marithrix sp.]